LTKPSPPTYAYQVGVFLGRLIFGAAGARVQGKENVPKSGSALIVSNHQSYLDPMFVAQGCGGRQVHYMAKEELFRVSTSRHLMLSLGAFPVDRKGPTRATLAQVLKHLREGSLVCLFAEGTRAKDGKLQPFQAGFARLAKKTNTPVIPMGLSGSRDLFEDIQGPSLPLWRNYLGQAAPCLNIGKPISPELSEEEIASRTHESVRLLIEECRG